MSLKKMKTSCPRDCFGGCSMNVYTEEGVIRKVEGEESNRFTCGKLCVKGMSYVDYVYSPNRVRYPMIRKGKRGEGNFQRVTWEHAISEIGQKLKSIKEMHGPTGLMFYSSGGCQGLLSDYYNGFFSQFGGFTTTKGNLCYSAGIEATKQTYGEVKHNSPDDIENAGLILLWGKNPASTNVQEMQLINNALSKGAKLLTIDPIRTSSAIKSHFHVSPEPGTDAELAYGIVNLLISRGSIDLDFVNKYTNGFDSLKRLVEKFTPSEVSKICRISEDEIISIVNMIENNKPMTLICGYGIQRYKNGGRTVKALSVIPALTGDIGIKGGGFRFANKQWTYLAWPYVSKSPYNIRSDYSAASLANAIKNHNNPGIKMLWIERANPMTMNPDINSMKEAFDKLDCIVVTDQFMTDTVRYADMVLPAQSFFEYDDIFTGYWTPYIGMCQKVIEPFYEAKNESQIYRMLGQYMGYNMDCLPEYNVAAIDEILKYSGIDTNVESLRKSPYMLRDNEIAFAGRKFKTPSGKIELYSEGISTPSERNSNLPPGKEHIKSGCEESYPLRFLSTHARERIHTQFGDIKRFNGNGAELFINPKDAVTRSINDGDRVSVFNKNGTIWAVARITNCIKDGTVNIYEGLGEDSGANVNILTSQETSDIGYGATYYDCYVEVKKAKA